MLQLTVAKLRLLFAAICVSERLCRRALKVLKNDQFADQYAIYRFVLDVLFEYFDEHKSLPRPAILRSNLLADLSTSEYVEVTDAQELAEIYRLIESLINEDEDFLVRAVTPYMDAFKEQCLKQRLQTILAEGDLQTTLKSVQLELREAIVADTDKFDNPLGKSFDQRQPGRFTPLGNPLIDLFTGGTGPATGEVIGHAAPSGAGKSTLVSQTALDATMRELAECKLTKVRPRITYIFNYEKLFDPLSHVLAYGARVPRTTIESYLNSKVLDPKEIFSHKGAYSDYEKQQYRRAIDLAIKGQGAFPNAEWERIQDLRKQIKDYLYIVDFSGSNIDLRKYSTDYVEGIEEFIYEHQLFVGNPGVNAVFLDYASAIARLHLGRAGRKNNRDTEYELLLNLPLRVKHSITNSMRCWGFISHQLAAVEGKRAGGMRPDPLAFKGCQAFSENCDFAFVTGVRTRDTNYAIFVQSKLRRGRQQSDLIGQLDGEFSHWRLADTTAITISGNRVVERTEALKLAGGQVKIAMDLQ